MSYSIKRRGFLRSLLGVSAMPYLAVPAGASRLGFQHGVASGDPLHDRVILWTRVSGSTEPVDVHWAVASDEAMQNVIADGTVVTGPEQDFTVKVDATGLPAGRNLYYRFTSEKVVSPTGRTRTLPDGPTGSLSLAVVSCANYPYGFFNVYREIAARDDIDVVVHLGDYIYEYGPGEYATSLAEELQREPFPAHELIGLEDFRLRYAQYRSDADLQAVHAAHPMIATWDDHELANDAWRAGSENHQAEEGAWQDRRDNAIRAFLEWMPVRVAHDREHTKVFRRFEAGDLVSLIMLDTRVYGRDIQADADPESTREFVAASMGDPERRLLGRRQEAWLRRSLQRSRGHTWQLIGQQVMVSPTRSPSLEPLIDMERPALLSKDQLAIFVEISRSNPPMILDTWNGYPSARQDFLKDLYEYARNPVVLSGDLHTSLAGNLVPWGHARPVAVELMTTSVTSPGLSENIPEKHPGALQDATLALNPTLRYMDTLHHGWMHVDVTHERCVSTWHVVDTVHARNYTAAVDKTLAVYAGRMHDGLQEL